MGLIGVIRTENNPMGAPIHECPELWLSPVFVDAVAGWSFRLGDVPDPLTDLSPWRLTIDHLIGHHVVYEAADTRVIWRIVYPDFVRNMVLCRWPD